MFSAEASKYVGRVGALAIALGIGGAVSMVPWAASADDSASSSTSADSPSHRVRPAPATRNLPTAAAEAKRNSRQQQASLPEVSVARVDVPTASRVTRTPAALTQPTPQPPANPTATPVASVAPATAPVVAEPTASATGFLTATKPAPSGRTTGAPAAPTVPLDFFTAATSLATREVNRQVSKQAAVAQPVLTSQPVWFDSGFKNTSTRQSAERLGPGIVRTVPLSKTGRASQHQHQHQHSYHKSRK
jgi:hypothetical protein